VELGKQLATVIQEDLDSQEITQDHDSSTLGLLTFFQEVKQGLNRAD
jgi:hypothetical protein